MTSIAAETALNPPDALQAFGFDRRLAQLEAHFAQRTREQKRFRMLMGVAFAIFSLIAGTALGVAIIATNRNQDVVTTSPNAVLEGTSSEVPKVQSPRQLILLRPPAKPVLPYTLQRLPPNVGPLLRLSPRRQHAILPHFQPRFPQAFRCLRHHQYHCLLPLTQATTAASRAIKNCTMRFDCTTTK